MSGVRGQSPPIREPEATASILASIPEVLREVLLEAIGTRGGARKSVLISSMFGVYKFDEVRGNLILGFVRMTPESEWTLSNR